MPRLKINVAGLELSNPTVLASGILGDEASLLRRAAYSGFGAVTTKSFTIEPRKGYKTPIVAKVKAGLINAVGLTNPGYIAIKDIVKNAKVPGVPIVVSLAGSSVDEFHRMAVYADEAGADAVELNLSCPHVKKMGMEIGHDPIYVAKIVGDIKGSITKPLFIKIGLSDNYMDVVGRALDKGADGVTAINTVRGIAIDVYAKRPILSNIYGGLSGPAIHPIATRIIYEIYAEYRASIIGTGGVEDWRDAVEFILAGASAIGIGTSITIRGLGIAKEVVEGIKRYMDNEGFKKLEDMIGYVHKT